MDAIKEDESRIALRNKPPAATDAFYARDSKDPRDDRDYRNSRDYRDYRDFQDYRDYRDYRGQYNRPQGTTACETAQEWCTYTGTGVNKQPHYCFIWNPPKKTVV